MGIFDKLLKAIGFEDENAEKTEIKSKNNKKEKKKEKNININSKFDLKNLEEDQVSEEKEIVAYIVKVQTDVEEIANKLKNGESVMVDFNKFAEGDKIRALDFLSGVSFILNGKIEKINKNTYFLKK